MTRSLRRGVVTALCALALGTDIWAAVPGNQDPTGDAAQPGAGGRPGGARRLPPPGLRPGGPPRNGGANPEEFSAAQAEQLFDSYVLGEARVALQLSPSQLMPFGQRLRRLQMIRRQGQRQRQQLLGDLNAVSRGVGPVDETALAAKLKALDDLTADVERQVREAYAALEETLTVRQRARFRIFEQRMERQKLELITRARQSAQQSGAGNSPESGQ